MTAHSALLEKTAIVGNFFHDALSSFSTNFEFMLIPECAVWLLAIYWFKYVL